MFFSKSNYNEEEIGRIKVAVAEKPNWTLMFPILMGASLIGMIYFLQNALVSASFALLFVCFQLIATQINIAYLEKANVPNRLIKTHKSARILFSIALFIFPLWIYYT